MNNNVNELELLTGNINLENVKDPTPIDEKVIQKAILVIKDAEVSKHEVKKLLIQLLEVIQKLRNTAKQLMISQDKLIIEDQFSGEENNIVGDKSKEEIVQSIQKFLTTHYQDVMNKFINGDKAMKKVLEDAIRKEVSKKRIIIKGYETSSASAEEIINELLGFPVIEKFLFDDDSDFDDFIEEININDFYDIRVYKSGKAVRVPERFDSPDHLKVLVDKFLRMSEQNQALDKNTPAVVLRIGTTTRVTITTEPFARRSPSIPAKGNTFNVRIRKQRSEPFTVEKLIQYGSVGRYEAALMKIAVSRGARILFFGGTNSGKTAAMTAFCQYIPNDKSVITISEVDEMNLLKIDMEEKILNEKGELIDNPNYMRPINSVIMFEVPNQNQTIKSGTKGFDGAIQMALTMTPQVIIMQEAKGTEMAKIIEAALTGHQTMTTAHADNYEIVSDRVIQMIIQALGLPADEIKKQIAAAFDMFAGLEKMDDGSRKMTSIVEITEFNKVTRDIDFRVLSEYVVTSVKKVNGKTVIEGKFIPRKLPSQKLKSRFMRVGGMMDEEFTKLQAVFAECGGNVQEGLKD